MPGGAVGTIGLRSSGPKTRSGGGVTRLQASPGISLVRPGVPEQPSSGPQCKGAYAHKVPGLALHLCKAHSSKRSNALVAKARQIRDALVATLDEPPNPGVAIAARLVRKLEGKGLYGPGPTCTGTLPLLSGPRQSKSSALVRGRSDMAPRAPSTDTDVRPSIPCTAQLGHETGAHKVVLSAQPPSPSPASAQTNANASAATRGQTVTGLANPDAQNRPCDTVNQPAPCMRTVNPIWISDLRQVQGLRIVCASMTRDSHTAQWPNSTAPQAAQSIARPAIRPAVSSTKVAADDRMHMHPASQMQKRTFMPDDPQVDADDDPAVRRAIALEHRKKRQKHAEHETDEARAARQLNSEIDEIVRLMPTNVRVHMLGGPIGIAQVPNTIRQDRIIARMLRKRAGSEGAQLASVRSFLCTARTYAATCLNIRYTFDIERRASIDNAIFPMSSTLAHELIASEDMRARTTANGSQGGATVGARLRDAIIFASKRLKWPIEIDKAVLDSAAEPAQKCIRRKAGTFPIGVKCFLEEIASERIVPAVADLAKPVVVWYARALLAGCLDQSLRVGECVRTQMSPDPVDPDNVMHGTGYLSKDGACIAIWAPAHGFLGPYRWWPEFYRSLASALYPVWTNYKGSGDSILHATGMKHNRTQSKAAVRKALNDIMSLAPLGYLPAEIKDMNLKGHSAHASPSEWGRQLMSYPTLKFELPDQYKRGFSQTECNVLGHWSRDDATKAQAAKARAIAVAAPGQERRAIAIATDDTDTVRNAAMQEYYGDPGSSANRWSERDLQVRTRLRLAKIVGLAVAHAGGWRRLPRGQADLQIISSVAA